MVSPCQVFSNSVIRTGDKSCRMCARCVRLRCHGERSQSNSPQQLEHKHAEEYRLERETTDSGKKKCPKYFKLWQRVTRAFASYPKFKCFVGGISTLTKIKAFKDPPCSVSALDRPMRIAYRGGAQSVKLANQSTRVLCD